MGQEVELKLEVPPRAIARLKRLHTLNRHGRPQEKDLVSVYFDTAEHTLRRHGMSLRVRHIGDKRVQTVKANGQCGAGLFNRSEWEKRIDSDTPDLRAASRTALAGLMNRKLAHALKPVFETQVHRTVVPLNGGASLIELTLDRGEVRLGRKSAPISEVELELKRGRPADLFAVARKLAEVVPTRFALRSKADRGYALVGGEPSKAVRAQAITLERDMSSGAAFHAIALGCLHHLAANEPAVRDQDPEGVHQMRVGVRRLRAAIAVFADLLDDDETARIKAGLKWLTAELGPARDLDVHVTGNIKPLQRTLPARRHIESLQGDLETSRKGAFDRATKAVLSARYRALVLDALAWIEGGEWTTSDDELIKARRRRKARDFAREVLARRLKKVSKRAKRLVKLDAHRRHKLCIGIKKLRYAADFFTTLFSGRKAQRRLHRFTRGLKQLQDRLGALNDIAVHHRLAGRQVGTRARRQRAFAIGLVSGREQSRVAPLRDAATGAADRLAQVRPFWA